MTESQFKSYKIDSSKDGRGKHVFRKSPLDKANKREAKNEISLAFVEQKTGLEKLELEINKMTVRNICSLYMNNLRKYLQARNPNPKEQEPVVSQLKEHPTAKSHGGNETHIQQEKTIRDRCLSGPITNREQLHDRHTQQTLMPTHQLKEHPIAKSHGGNETHIQQKERLRDRCVSDPITNREQLHDRHTQQTLVPTHQLKEHPIAKSHGGNETHIQQEERLRDRCVSDPITNREQLHDRHTQQTLVPTHQLKEHPIAKSHGGNETHIQQEERIRDRCVSDPITNREQLHGRQTQQTLMCTSQLREHHTAKSHGGTETHTQQEEILRYRCVSDPITSREQLHGRQTQQTPMPTHQLREHPIAKSHGGTETHIQQLETLRDRFVSNPITSREQLHGRQTHQTPMPTHQLREHHTAKSHGGNETQIQQQERLRYRYVSDPITNREQLSDRKTQQTPMPTHQLREHPIAKSHGGNETHIQQEETLRDRCVSDPITSREQLHGRQTQQTPMPTHQLREHPIAKSHGGNETHIQQEETLRDRCVSDPITSREQLHGRQTQQTPMPTHQLREHPIAKSHGGTETHIQQLETLRYRYVSDPITNREQLSDRKTQQTTMPTHQLREHPIAKSHGGNETHIQQEERPRVRFVNDPITNREQMHDRQTQQTLMPTNKDIEAKLMELMAERRTECNSNADFLMKKKKVDRIWMKNQRRNYPINEWLIIKKIKKRDKKMRKKIRKVDKKEKKKRRTEAKKEKKRQKKEAKWKNKMKGKEELKREEKAEMEEGLKKLWEMPESDSGEWEGIRRDLFFIRWMRYMRFVASLNTKENRLKKWWRKFQHWKDRREEQKLENREKKQKMRREKKFILEEELRQIDELSNPGDEEWEFTKMYLFSQRWTEYINYVAVIKEKEQKERERQKREEDQKNNPSWFRRMFRIFT